uniref:BPI2 domain-containing protein n=1 Tax=Globodera pallida TaxID=36090 RepID=A0A183BQQ3_GLOPA
MRGSAPGLDVMTLTLTPTPMTPMTPFLGGVMTYDADAVTGILRHFCVTMTLTPMTPMTPFLSGVMTYDADAVTGLSKKMTLTRDADSGTGDVQPCSAHC